MAIHDALNTSTLRWRAVPGVRPGYELADGSETLALARVGEVEIGDRLYRTEAQKGGTVLVDVATGARVAAVRPMAHGVTAINARAGRYRLTRRRLPPFRHVVTSDFGGPEVLDILHVGSLVRVRGGAQADVAPPDELDLLTVLTGMAMLDLLTPVHAPV